MIEQIVPFQEHLPAVWVVAREGDGGSSTDQLVEVEEAE